MPASPLEVHTGSQMVVTSNGVGYLDYENERNGARSQTSANETDTDLNLGGLIDRVLDAVIVARLTNGRIVLWNPAAERLFGYTAEQAIGRPIEMLMPEPLAHIHRAGMERYMRTGHGLIIDADSPVEMPARTRSGEEVRVEITLSELLSPSGERYAMAVMRDARHRKQLELANLELVQARVARSEAEARLAAVDELLDSVGATLEANPTVPELKRVVRGLTDVRRIRSGEMRVRVVDADVVDLVHAASDAARRRAANRRLLVYAPPSAMASCDPSHVRQVLDHVLEEAIQRTPEGGRIELDVHVNSPQVVQVSIRTEGDGQPHSPGVGVLVSRMLVQHQGERSVGTPLKAAASRSP